MMLNDYMNARYVKGATDFETECRSEILTRHLIKTLLKSITTKLLSVFRWR